MESDTEHRGQRQVAGDHLAQFTQSRFQTVDHRKDLARSPQKNYPLRGEGKTFFAALNQADRMALFQRLDLLAHRALRDAVELRSLRKTGGFGQIAEYFEKQELHGTMRQTYDLRALHKQI